MRLDEHLRPRGEAAGLVPAELERLYADSGSIAPGLAKIGAAEADQLHRRAVESEQVRHDASLIMGVGSRRWRRDQGPSFSLSVRLDHEELAELRRRASEQGNRVSVLARSYIRAGLARPHAPAAR